MNKLLDNCKKSFKMLKWYEWAMMIIMIGVAIFSVISAHIGHNVFIPSKLDATPIWLAYVNFVSAVCGVACVFLTARRSISNFVFAIVNTTVYILYLWYYKIYGTLVLETVVYFPMNIIMWIFWARHRDEDETFKTKSKKMNWWQNLLVVLGIAGTTVLTHFLLMDVLGLEAWGKLTEDYSTRIALTWLDSATFAIGIVAIFLELFRFREQYVWWIITDIVAVTLYAIKVPFDPVYFTKKSIYLIVAVIGIIEWIKGAKKNTTNE